MELTLQLVVMSSESDDQKAKLERIVVHNLFFPMNNLEQFD